MDELGIGILATSSQKCLATPPGVAIVAVSDDAAERLRESPTLYMDLRRWIEVSEEPGKYLSTPAVNVFMALHRALEMVLDEGMEARWARHDVTASFLRREMAARGTGVVAEDPPPTVSVFDVEDVGKQANIEVRIKGFPSFTAPPSGASGSWPSPWSPSSTPSSWPSGARGGGRPGSSWVYYFECKY
ncbi:MAG: aminotransferase class V-fold PLP-dependent enzyme [Nitrososphaeria archaeon]